MEVKLADHELDNRWNCMECKDLPIGMKTIMAIWSFKCKQFPDGTLNKHKGSLCAHGGQQTWGYDYRETYAPVVSRVSSGLLLFFAKRENRQNLHAFNLWPVEYHTKKNSCPNLIPVLLYVETYACFCFSTNLHVLI